jgi:hypothetical protein
VELLRQPNIRGATSEVICGALLTRAPRALGDLVRAIECESDERVKRLLLRVIAESRLPEAVPVLGRHFYDSDGRVRGCCITALRAIGSEEARRALAENGWS